jgi:hypothetical protein
MIGIGIGISPGLNGGGGGTPPSYLVLEDFGELLLAADNYLLLE